MRSNSNNYGPIFSSQIITNCYNNIIMHDLSEDQDTKLTSEHCHSCLPQ